MDYFLNFVRVIRICDPFIIIFFIEIIWCRRKWNVRYLFWVTQNDIWLRHFLSVDEIVKCWSKIWYPKWPPLYWIASFFPRVNCISAIPCIDFISGQIFSVAERKRIQTLPSKGFRSDPNSKISQLYRGTYGWPMLLSESSRECFKEDNRGVGR